MKTAGWMPKVVMTNDGAYSDQNWLVEQKKTNGGAGWMGRDPTDVESDRRMQNDIAQGSTDQESGARDAAAEHAAEIPDVPLDQFRALNASFVVEVST
jgi:hypothetical protein